MAKKKKGLTSANKAMITRRFNAGTAIPDISQELDISVTLVRRYVLRWCREENDKYWSYLIRSVGKSEIPGHDESMLIAHHILEKGAFPWLRWDLDNGICIAINYHDTRYGNIKEMSTHGTLHQLDMFKDWLMVNKYWQYEYYLNHKDDRQHEEVDILETYYRLKAIYEKGVENGKGHSEDIVQRGRIAAATDEVSGNRQS